MQLGLIALFVVGQEKGAILALIQGIKVSSAVGFVLDWSLTARSSCTSALRVTGRIADPLGNKRRENRVRAPIRDIAL